MQKPKSFINQTLRLLNATMQVAALDGGKVIALQIVNFLMNFFYLKNMPAETNAYSFIVPILGILNFSVIIYRIACLLRGVKHELIPCYFYAIRRLSVLILLYLIGSVLLLALAKPIVSVFMLNKNLAILLSFGLIPFGLLTCVFIVDQQKNAMQAISATYHSIRYIINPKLLLITSIMYSLPCVALHIIEANITFQYMDLIRCIWLLFCHIFTIVIYIDSLNSSKTNANQTANKATKIIVI